MTIAEIMANPSILQDPEMECEVRDYLSRASGSDATASGVGYILRMISNERHFRNQIEGWHLTTEQLIEEFRGSQAGLELCVSSSDLAYYHALEDMLYERGINPDHVGLTWADRAEIRNLYAYDPEVI